MESAKVEQLSLEQRELVSELSRLLMAIHGIKAVAVLRQNSVRPVFSMTSSSCSPLVAVM
jgi:hypothetical protein